MFMRKTTIFSCYLLILCLFVSFSWAQNKKDKTSDKKPAPVLASTETKPSLSQLPVEKYRHLRTAFHSEGNLPFQPGETLVYELRYSRFPIYGTIGELTFTVNEDLAITQPASDNAKDKELNKDKVEPIEKEKPGEKDLQKEKPKVEDQNGDKQSIDKQNVDKQDEHKLNIDSKEKSGPNANMDRQTVLTELSEGFRITSVVNKEDSSAKKDEVAKNSKTGAWKIEVKAVSKGILTSLFRVKLEDVFTSLVDRKDFGVTKTIKNIDESKKRREAIAEFDRANEKVKWVETDLVTNKVLQTKNQPALDWATDIASGWYVLRAQKMKVGDTISFPLSDNGDTYNIDVIVLGEEKVETDFGKFSTYKLEMKLFDGKFIRRKGTLLLWVTKDDRHIPVRATIQSGFGTVTAKITEMKNIKQL